MGKRQRYRLLDLHRLCWRLGTDRLEELIVMLDFALQKTIAEEQMNRDSSWTESLAVGSPTFLAVRTVRSLVDFALKILR